MNLLFTVDHNFVKPLCVLLYSIKKNTPKNKKNIIFLPYIIGDEFTSREKRLIKRQVKKIDEIRYIELPIEAKIYASDKKRWGYQIWNKFTSLFFLPDSVSKILFIDADCIINSDITSYYNLDITSTSFIGIEENNGQALKRINLPSSGKYICVAFLLINTLLFKKKMVSLKNLLTEIRSFPYEYKCDEQDFINYHFQDSIVSIKDRRYNFFVLWNTEEKDERIVVYHFAGSPKPWIEYKKKYSFSIFHIYWRYGKHVYGLAKYLRLYLQGIISAIKWKIKH